MMKYFTYSTKWAALPVLMTLLITYLVFQRKEQFYSAIETGHVSFNLALLMFWGLVVLGIGYTIVPYRIVTTPLLKYRFNEKGLFYNKRGKEMHIPAGSVSELHFPPTLKRDVGAIGSVWLKIDNKWHKIPTGYDLSPQEWKHFEGVMVK
ncbi:hypothetical protein [Idiomarina sp. HP20-50]|uniref:hypothetical protein n=1 Tax=Idiomarina sp. HP20-50 TaxID=3070813 RepID=UPI00294AA728|nr:hypothetical protein [Idiomarina sp. HP20-50]MDV6315740.1 hypothetical protein [Idiomarina sp. HP20-50]